MDAGHERVEIYRRCPANAENNVVDTTANSREAMKMNVFLTILGIAISCLVGYLVYYTANGSDNSIACGVISSLSFTITLVPAIGFKYESTRLGINARVLALVFFTIFVVEHFCAALFGLSMPVYISFTGICAAVYLAIMYKISQIDDI